MLTIILLAATLRNVWSNTEILGTDGRADLLPPPHPNRDVNFIISCQLLAVLLQK